MKVKFVYKVLPAFIFYTDRLRFSAAGCANGPVVRIRPHYRNDEGLLQHELTHVKQSYRLAIIAHGLLYKFSQKYRLRAEVEAYKKQLEYSADWNNDRVRFAGFVCQKYGLDITFQDAWQLLGGGKI